MNLLLGWRQNPKAGRVWRLLGGLARGRGSHRQSLQLVFDFEAMGTQTQHPRLKTDVFDDAYVKGLFDRMGPSYAVVNFVSSFGFSEVWRRQCVDALELKPGERVADLMAGTGECWRYIQRQGGELVSIDFSPVMARRQQKRNRDNGGAVDVRCENALQTSLWDGSLDCAVSAFGLKTLNDSALRGFAGELWRILKPGGRFSLMEISTAKRWRWAPIFRWYVNKVIPAIGKLCLGDIECYRMLGSYTEKFESCRNVRSIFANAGFEVEVRSHFFGCATSLVGRKPVS